VVYLHIFTKSSTKFLHQTLGTKEKLGLDLGGGALTETVLSTTANSLEVAHAAGTGGTATLSLDW
jgi:hypothetical protein